jgi:hypothetical protein
LARSLFKPRPEPEEVLADGLSRERHEQEEALFC